MAFLGSISLKHTRPCSPLLAHPKPSLKPSSPRAVSSGSDAASPNDHDRCERASTLPLVITALYLHNLRRGGNKHFDLSGFGGQGQTHGKDCHKQHHKGQAIAYVSTKYSTIVPTSGNSDARTIAKAEVKCSVRRSEYSYRPASTSTGVFLVRPMSL